MKKIMFLTLAVIRLYGAASSSSVDLQEVNAWRALAAAVQAGYDANLYGASREAMTEYRRQNSFNYELFPSDSPVMEVSGDAYRLGMPPAPDYKQDLLAALQSSRNSLFKVLHQDFGGERAVDFRLTLQKIWDQYLSQWEQIWSEVEPYSNEMLTALLKKFQSRADFGGLLTNPEFYDTVQRIVKTHQQNPSVLSEKFRLMLSRAVWDNVSKIQKKPAIWANVVLIKKLEPFVPEGQVCAGFTPEQIKSYINKFSKFAFREHLESFVTNIELLRRLDASREVEGYQQLNDLITIAREGSLSESVLQDMAQGWKTNEQLRYVLSQDRFKPIITAMLGTHKVPSELTKQLLAKFAQAIEEAAEKLPGKYKGNETYNENAEVILDLQRIADMSS